MLQPLFKIQTKGQKMNVVCFISGSGTNYREIVKSNPLLKYLVFTNRPGCEGLEIARQNEHPYIELSHVPYLREIRKQYGPGKVPHNCSDRVTFEKEAVRLIEQKLGQQPDLICLAGYDQVNSDWFVDRYSPRILNVHPGDTTKGYNGLHIIPSAKAIIAGEKALRSTLFFVDKGVDTGPVLVQSAALPILETLKRLDETTKNNLQEAFIAINRDIAEKHINNYTEFISQASDSLKMEMEKVCGALQYQLKVMGDWKIFPYVVGLIAQGKVAVDGRRVFIEGKELPDYGLRLDEN
jgi:phosphoribosylglycinamide formyltransferase 1